MEGLVITGTMIEKEELRQWNGVLTGVKVVGSTVEIVVGAFGLVIDVCYWPEKEKRSSRKDRIESAVDYVKVKDLEKLILVGQHLIIYLTTLQASITQY